METHIIILAAGKGTRMCSAQPKVAHKIADKAMLAHVVDTARQLKPAQIHVIVGFEAPRVKALVDGVDVHWVAQCEQLGTGHAVRQVLPFLPKQGVSLILFGDVPLILAQTLKLLRSRVTANSLALISQFLAEPTGYGRIVRDAQDKVTAIVEQRDASAQQLLINEVNTGIMALNNAHLHAWLPLLNNDNAQREFYLPDLLLHAVAAGVAIETLQAQYDYEVQGVNTPLQLAQLERAYQHAQAKRFLEQGLQLADPQRFDVRGTLQFGQDCQIDINCIFEGEVCMGQGVKIEANTIIRNSHIGDYSVIRANSLIEDSRLDAHCEVGPFARLRPQTHLKQKAKIGNFVETKNVTIGEGSKVNHLSYIGDAEIGKACNIGAGTITCNYDGVNKHKTVIGDEVYIGSNNSLVAPLQIDDRATTGAGTIVRKPVEAHDLVISGGKQKNIKGWKRPSKKSSS